MKKKLLTTLFILIFCVFAIQLNTFATVIISTDKEVASGSGEVNISVTSKQPLGAYTLTLTNTSGLELLNTSSSGTLSADKKMVTGFSTSGITTLATFTFKVPTVTSDTTYNVQFSITGMATPDETDIPNETNTAVIKVTAPAQAPQEQPSNPNVSQEPEPQPETPTLSSDTSLASLSISPFGKINKASTGIYDITVNNDLEKVTITAVANDSKASVSGNGEFSLQEGTNNFKIVVQAEDGSKEEHKIRIIRKASETPEETTPPNVIDEEKDNEEEENPDDENKSDELGLSNLVLTGIELNPKFSEDVYEYKAEFSEDMDTLEILATPNTEDATVEIIGNSNLKEGENLITIIVKSSDEENTKTYQILVTKHTDEVLASSTSVDNTTGASATEKQELKNKIGKVILIAVAAVIAVILIGIILIINTKKKNQDSQDDEDRYEKFGKDDFKIAVDEEESYKELEKLSNIHNKNNIFGDVSNDESDVNGDEISNDDKNEAGNVTENYYNDIVENNTESDNLVINNIKDESDVNDFQLNNEPKTNIFGEKYGSPKESIDTNANNFDERDSDEINFTDDDMFSDKKSKGKRFK